MIPRPNSNPAYTTLAQHFISTDQIGIHCWFWFSIHESILYRKDSAASSDLRSTTMWTRPHAGARPMHQSLRASSLHGLHRLRVHAHYLPDRSGRAVRPNRRPSPRGARFTGHAKVRLWSRRTGSVAPRRVTCRCKGLTNPPSPPTPSSVSLDFDSCPGQPPPAKSVAAPP